MQQGPNHRRSAAARTLLTMLSLCFMAVPLHAAAEEAHVLMLYGVDPYLPPFIAMDMAIRDSLVGKTGRPVTFFAESLDTQRFAMETLEPEIADLLAKKYKTLRVEVVVAVSRTALEFFERYGAQIWPGARVVYVGFLGHEFEPTALPAGATAVVSTLDAAGTIDIARRLQPRARRIVVVSGVSEIDQTAERQARDALASLDGRPGRRPTATLRRRIRSRRSSVEGPSANLRGTDLRKVRVRWIDQDVEFLRNDYRWNLGQQRSRGGVPAGSPVERGPALWNRVPPDASRSVEYGAPGP